MIWETQKKEKLANFVLNAARQPLSMKRAAENVTAADTASVNQMLLNNLLVF